MSGEALGTGDYLTPEHVEFRRQQWFVAVADFDDDGQGGGHWHLTLTAPQKPRRVWPLRSRRTRPVASKATWEDGVEIEPLPLRPVPGGWNGR